ncbi:Pyridoxamine 5'-phosphate oxidase [Drechslerella dactyloides]|uniref:Pyridoxamine 5'-phosphate oxidase n=1 Tax=Drechslerella dactyloides TaxID=74499 RepID=A0AAD6J5H2_DREDA|nr:Pyridoxamine 5'-phosphate oxidase [Drechslerella dactyloides]
MPKFYPALDPNLTSWALSQPLFFTATAPLTGSHVNLSPKGLPTASLAIPTPSTLLYIDSTGSGCETISHLYENGRITILFLSFDASPRIMRLFCRGRVVEKGTAEYQSLLPHLGASKSSSSETIADDSTKSKAGDSGMPTARAIIFCDIFKVQTSCGFGVPLFLNGHWEDRPTLNGWGAKKLEGTKLADYQVENNVRSLDGLPGLRSARKRKGEWMSVVEGWGVLARIWGYPACLLLGIVLGWMLAGGKLNMDWDALWQTEDNRLAADW